VFTVLVLVALPRVDHHVGGQRPGGQRGEPHQTECATHGDPEQVAMIGRRSHDAGESIRPSGIQFFSFSRDTWALEADNHQGVVPHGNGGLRLLLRHCACGSDPFPRSHPSTGNRIPASHQIRREPTDVTKRTRCMGLYGMRGFACLAFLIAALGPARGAPREDAGARIAGCPCWTVLR
jgi:hypothetical protein